MRTKGMGTLSPNFVVNKKRQSGNTFMVNANTELSSYILKIYDYDKDMGMGAFWGWDMKFAMEDNRFYSFEFEHRMEKMRVYVLLHREPVFTNGNPSAQYECYVQDMNDRWKTTNYFTIEQLGKDVFYDNIEGIIENMYINL